ncbi:MAG TPA: hypothetical protein VFY93_14065 [Planctomycetota bacterium]|nr:hypothetical protein [Planctomycetota bacterium]
MGSVLFPDTPRGFRGRRTLKIALRGVHVLCAALCLGAYAFDAPGRGTWLLAAALSGVLILALDLHESAAFLFEVRGLVVAMKVLALAFLPSGGAWLLGAVVLVSVVSSHAPSSLRHRLLVGRGRVRISGTRG